MQKPSDETLVAYLDGELDESARSDVQSWLDNDADLRERVAALAASAAALRAAFEPVLHEPVPERLLAAARGTEIVDFAAAQKTRASRGSDGPPNGRAGPQRQASPGCWSAAVSVSSPVAIPARRSRPMPRQRAGSTTSPAITSC